MTIITLPANVVATLGRQSWGQQRYDLTEESDVTGAVAVNTVMSFSVPLARIVTRLMSSLSTPGMSATWSRPRMYVGMGSPCGQMTTVSADALPGVMVTRYSTRPSSGSDRSASRMMTLPVYSAQTSEIEPPIA